MSPFAEELNAVLEGTVAGRLLSDMGKRMYFPRGIVSQSAEASARAHRLNATIGMAVEDGEPMVLPQIAAMVPRLSRRELTAYAPTAGLPALREVWKNFMLEKNPLLRTITMSKPAVIPGLTNGVYHASELFLSSGDVVIMPDMFWGNYRLIMEVRRGAEIKTFPLFNETLGFNLAGFDNLVREHEKRGKLVIALNFPNNPTGYTPTRAEVKELVAVLCASADRGTDIAVICDDAYYGLFFEEDVETQSVFAHLAAAHQNILAIKVDGSTKEDYVWSFRIGFMTMASKSLQPEHYESLTKKLMGSIRASVSSSSGLAQNILLKTYQDSEYHQVKKQKRDLLEARYMEVRRIVEDYEAKGARVLKSLPFNSGYFMTFECRGFDAEALRLRLLDDGIGTISIGTRLLRIAYAGVDTNKLQELYSEIFKTAEKMVAPQ